MKRMVAGAAALACFLTAQPIPAQACTTFCVKAGDSVLFGRNYDFEIGGGALFVNTRGLKKRGFAPNGPEWAAAYGSVTFNQFGRDFPMGGMNEKGLVVELAWLDVTEYPAPDNRAELGVLEWIQYQLDTAATVADVVKSDAAVRISGVAPLHYLVSDPTGAAATIEFLGGRLVVHTNESLPVTVLANTSYEDSLRFWRRKGESSLPRGSGSEARFARTATQLGTMTGVSGRQAIDRAFSILGNVAQRSTRWSIVYDQTAQIVYFRTDTHHDVRLLQTSALNFSCSGPVRLVDLDLKAGGDISAHLVPYSAEANQLLVNKNYRASSVTRRTPPSEIQAIADHPALATCSSKESAPDRVD